MSESLQNTTKIMGILNATPDSFFAESRLVDNITIDFQKYKHADIVDVGFESSRPGANPISEIDELNMINDISGGGKNGEMLGIAALFNCPIVLMHMQGNPLTMQNEPIYDDIMDELKHYFESKIELAKNIGLKDSQIIIAPGIGFGKRIIDNDTIINKLGDLKQFGFPVLIGISRKSFLSIDDDEVEDRLPATLGATALAVKNGADIIRVHDVKENYQMLTVISRIIQRNYVNEIIV